MVTAGFRDPWRPARGDRGEGPSGDRDDPEGGNPKQTQTTLTNRSRVNGCDDPLYELLVSRYGVDYLAGLVVAQAAVTYPDDCAVRSGAVP